MFTIIDFIFKLGFLEKGTSSIFASYNLNYLYFQKEHFLLSELLFRCYFFKHFLEFIYLRGKIRVFKNFT